MTITPRGANPHIDQNGTFLYTDFAGDSLIITAATDVLVFVAEDGTPVELSPDAVHDLVVWLHQWLGDVDTPVALEARIASYEHLIRHAKQVEDMLRSQLKDAQ